MPLLAPVTTAVRCMRGILPVAARTCRLELFTPVSLTAASSLTIGLVAEAVQQVRAVIFDWGGVITNPILDTVAAWLAADPIDRDSYAAAMRPWVQRAYGPQDGVLPIHALGRREVTDAQVQAN